MMMTMASTDQDRFTEELKVAAGDQWNRVVNHRFTVELADGTIDSNGELNNCAPERVWKKIGTQS